MLGVSIFVDVRMMLFKCLKKGRCRTGWRLVTGERLGKLQSILSPYVSIFHPDLIIIYCVQVHQAQLLEGLHRVKVLVIYVYASCKIMSPVVEHMKAFINKIALN
jgi:hypothetical protein